MTLLEKDWGFIACNASAFRVELLPRLTVTNVPHATEINLGFLCFQVWLTLFSREMREFNRRTHDTE